MQIKAFMVPVVPFKSGPVHVKEGQAQEDQWKTARMFVNVGRTTMVMVTFGVCARAWYTQIILFA